MTKKKKTAKRSSAVAKRRTSAVATLDESEFTALEKDPADIAEIIESNIGPDGFNRFDLERVALPAGGRTAWTLETIEGEKELDEIEGIILLKRTTRVYWKQSYDETGGNMPPDCSSEDGYQGVGDPGGDCKSCELNVFGTAEKGDGKACKEVLVLFVLIPGKLLPLVIAVTPGSLRVVRKYFLRLAGEGYASYLVTTKFQLEKATNKRGIHYARVKPKIGRALDDDEVAAVRRYVDNIKPALQQHVEVTQAEVEGEG